MDRHPPQDDAIRPHGDPAAEPTPPAERTVDLHSPDGARLRVNPLGGQVLGWQPGPEHDRLWLSEAAVFAVGTPVRGGIPVIFPQFAARGPLPKHGLVRDRLWHSHALPDAQAALWQAWTHDDEHSRRLWPHRFSLQLTARADASSLRVDLQVHNPDDHAWSFSAVLHTYLRVRSAQAHLVGLSGLSVEPNERPGTLLSPQQVADWTALGTRDVRVPAVPGPVLLVDPDAGDLQVSAENLPDVVVWNPGPDHGLSDVPPGGERTFVCVEPALVEPISLAAGETWTGSTTLSVD